MKSNVIKMNVDVTTLKNANDFIFNKAIHHISSYVCISNVHMCMEVHDDNSFSKVVNNADLVLPDGRPIYWAQRLLGFKNAQQVRGQDLMNSICSLGNDNSLKIGLYGGSSNEVLSTVVNKLKIIYPNINIVFQYSPPFRALTENEDIDIINVINSSTVNILFVGIGCPKQEYWMAMHKGKVNCVMLGVGAAFDFISGTKKHAPKWMQYIGLEWLFRLSTEPKRLWKRYLKHNPRFILLFVKQLIKAKYF